ncbi:MAG: hypothetical protein LUH51_04340, partial [Firmicutes bacterium]|nr:hypothetical protein [Bacillota bacterium]
MTAYAAETLSGLTVDDLSVQYTNGTWSASGTTINGSATGEDGLCSNSSETSTLVLTNEKTSTAKLMFNYTVTLNDGSVTVGGTSVSSDGTYSYSGDIEDDGTLQIVLTSGVGANYTTSITITDIYLLVEQDVTTTFAVAENGSYTVNGSEITASTTYTQSSTTAYSLAATPADGYQFLGWYSTTDGKYLSTSASTSLYLSSDQTVTAVFGSTNAPVFETGGGRFTDLNEAVAYAQKMSASRITLVADGTLPAGDYTIPAGITLLIPFDDAGTCYTTEPAYSYNTSWTSPVAYRTLTMESGASITVNGSLSISAKVNAAGSGSGNLNKSGGSTIGSYGYVYMEDGSSITIGNGGGLYCWGYLSGNGEVTAESGAVVYEPFQLADFRGGGATSSMTSGVFPLSQWYLQNIEAKLTIKAGASEYGFTALYASNTTVGSSVALVGSSGMFQLESGSSLVKSYDPSTDRTSFEIYGDATLGSISLSIMSAVTINSANYKLPLNTNIDLIIHSGTTTVSQDIDVLPGVEMTVDAGATLTVSSGSNVYLYDLEDWDNSYFYGSAVRPTVYSPTRTYTRSNSNLKDAVLDVNGTVNVSGGLYTTESGAAIISSEGTGKVIMTNGAGTETTTQQATQSGTSVTYVDISITSAQLMNGDGSYTVTEGATSNTTYTYNKSEEKWVTACTEHTAGEAVIENEVAATCTESGSYDSVVYCTVCGEEISRETIVVEATGHSYTSEVTTEATCTEDGVITYTCSVCGDTYTETISALGHEWGEGVITTEATCTEEGVLTYTCSRCGETKTEAISATGHTVVVDEAVAATCTASGLTEGSHCSVCGAVIVEQEVVPALGHDYTSEVTKEATCTEDGVITYTCTRCGDTYMETISATGHSYEAVVTAPTCTEQGYTTYTCSACGDSYVSNYVDALGHSYDEGVVTKEATCTEDGVMTYTCTVCGETKTDTIAATGHTYVGEVTTPATCTEDGVMTWTCSVCGDSYTEVIPSTGHTYEAVVTEPTYTTRGYTTYTCTVCGDSYIADETDYLSGWATTDEGTQYYEGGSFKTGLTTIDGELYYFDESGYAVTGLTGITDEGGTFHYYYFGTDFKAYRNGTYALDETQTEGLIEAGSYAFDENGILQLSGWVIINGFVYYYDPDSHTAVTGIQRVPYPTILDGYSAAEDDIDNVSYPDAETSLFIFGADGVFQIEQNGFCEYDGETRWAVNGQIPWHAGLVQDEGETYPGTYYYFSTNGQVKGQTYYITKTNGLKPQGYYVFDSDGKMVLKYGIVEENGSLYYYNENGAKEYAGLIQIDGSYYYVNSSFQVVHDCTYYVSKTNGLMDAGYYTFDEDGKMVTSLNGIVKETEDTWYYYVNDVKTYAGLIEIDGYYYYVRTSGEVVHGCTYYISKTNGL